jgi:hypothetical protein
MSGTTRRIAERNDLRRKVIREAGRDDAFL